MRRSPRPAASPSGITTGPDGNIWFTERHGRQDRGITPAGAITEFPLPTAGAGPRRSRRGPTATSGSPRRTATRSAGSPRPGRSPSSRSPRPAASRMTSRPGPTAISGSPSRTATRSAGSRPLGPSPSSPSPRPAVSPYGITAGPDGNLWFTEQAGNKIGRITPTGIVHRVRDPHGRQPADRDHDRPRRQPLVHRAGRQPDRPDHAHRHRHRVRGPHRGQPTRRDHGRARRQPLVHREGGQPGRADHADGRRHRVRDPDGRQQPLRLAHDRPRRQPLVHRIRGQPDRPGHAQSRAPTISPASPLPTIHQRGDDRRLLAARRVVNTLAGATTPSSRSSWTAPTPGRPTNGLTLGGFGRRARSRVW